MKNIYLKISFFLIALSSWAVMVGCKPAASTVCHISGQMESNRWDGQYIYLVPMFGVQDAAHVDSAEIKDGKFEITVDTVEMKVIRVDYHFRDGAQELLVVSEPGNVNVTIGANSTSSGTPQNDSLQVWKDKLLEYNKAYSKLRMQARMEGSDNLLLTKGKEIQKAQREFNIAFAKRQPEGVFKNFLTKMYPSK